jgi:competence ComEA-like helix-hairpin-helix protein
VALFRSAFVHLHSGAIKPRLRRFLALSAGSSLLAASFCLATTKKPPLKPVNLNSATSEELQQVPGIGPATAEKILQMRKSYGAFKSVDDLMAIRGIGKKRLEKMRRYLVAGRPAAPQAAHCSNCTKANQSATKPAPAKPAPHANPANNPAPSQPDADEPEEPRR